MPDLPLPPSTPCALVAVGGDDRRSLATDVALDLERDKQRLLNTVFGTMAVAVTSATVFKSVEVFGVGPILCLVFVLAATLGVSLTLATAALTGTALDIAGRVYWRRVARRYGLNPEVAEQVLEDARLQLQAQDAARVVATRKTGHLLLPGAPPAPCDVP
ncbi:MAG: hypothetical protein FJ137_20960 [Deltaproteobacteria bacterium]|nr:hypothetical protein [Deltaproteobacteria bacterium]